MGDLLTETCIHFLRGNMQRRNGDTHACLLCSERGMDLELTFFLRHISGVHFASLDQQSCTTNAHSCNHAQHSNAVQIHMQMKMQMQSHSENTRVSSTCDNPIKQKGLQHNHAQDPPALKGFYLRCLDNNIREK